MNPTLSRQIGVPLLLLVIGGIVLIVVLPRVSQEENEYRSGQKAALAPGEELENDSAKDGYALELRPNPEETMRAYRMAQKDRIRYNADEILESTEDGTITLKGHAWWRLDDRIVGGQHDPRSVIVIDSETFQIVSKRGNIGESLLIR